MLYLTIITVNVLSLFFQIYYKDVLKISIHYFCLQIRFEDFNVSLDWNET